MKKLLRRLPLILFVGLIVGGLVYGFRPQPIPVDLAAVTRGEMVVTVNEDGKTRIKQRFVITAPLAGKLRRVEHKPGADLGELYASNQMLAWIEPSLPALLDARSRDEAEARKSAFQAKVEQTRELVKKAEKNEAFARSEFSRIERSLSSGGSSRQELEEAELKLRVAERESIANRFAVQVAEFEVKQAQAALKLYNPSEAGKPLAIPSPIDKGKVLRVMQESEKVLAAGAEIMEVGDPELLEAEIDMLTQDAVRVEDKKPATLEHWGEKVPLKGNVRLTEFSGFMKQSALGVEEQRVNVIIDFDVPEEYRGRVRDAYRVEARIEVWRGKDIVKVPSAAHFRHGKERAVYVRENGKAALRIIEIGEDNGLETQVKKGLEVGEEVLKHPGDKIKPGVNIVPREQVD